MEETTTKRGSDGSEETRVCRTDRYGNTECSTVRLAADGSTVETKEDGGGPGGRDMMTNEKVTTKSIFDKFFGQR